MSGSGEIMSPGFETSKGYPHLSTCVWRVETPPDVQSVTLVFDQFDLHSSDRVSVSIRLLQHILLVYGLSTDQLIRGIAKVKYKSRHHLLVGTGAMFSQDVLSVMVTVYLR